jgi:hypothetical protein
MDELQCIFSALVEGLCTHLQFCEPKAADRGFYQRNGLKPCVNPMFKSLSPRQKSVEPSPITNTC